MNYETRRRISLALKGKKKTIQHRKKIAQSLRGTTKTKQHKEAIAEAMKRYYENNRLNFLRYDK
ncbi:MAG: hypothetical protein UD103_07945 [Bacteroidales bacterium]|nr:hypothetical protein [Bacteroidales bacterium]